MKKLMYIALLAPLALGSCGLFNKTPGSAAKSVSSVSATVVEGTEVTKNGATTLTTSAWAGGTGKLMIDLYDYTDKKTVQEGETALAADGKFSFTSLPTPKDSELSKPQDGPTDDKCSGEISVSDKSARMAYATFRTDADKKGAVLIESFTDKTRNMGALTYSDRAVTTKGKIECKDDAGKVVAIIDIDVKYAKGWNWVTNSINADMTVTPYSQVSRNGMPKDAQWVYLTSAQAAALKAAPFNLR